MFFASSYKKTKTLALKDVYIKNPCNQNWDDMTPTEDGKFCAICKKEVFDFRGATNEKLTKHYHANKGSVCGVFNIDEISKPPIVKTGFMYRFYNKASLLFTAFLFRITTFAIADDHKPIKKEATTLGQKINLSFKEKEIKRTSKNARIYGQVKTDKDKSPSTELIVYLYDTKGNELFKTLSNREGLYEFNLPDTFNLSKNYIIKIPKQKYKLPSIWTKYTSTTQYVTFEHNEIEVPLTVKNKTQSLYKNSKNAVMGHWNSKRKKRKWWTRIWW